MALPWNGPRGKWTKGAEACWPWPCPPEESPGPAGFMEPRGPEQLGGSAAPQAAHTPFPNILHIRTIFTYLPSFSSDKHLSEVGQ